MISQEIIKFVSTSTGISKDQTAKTLELLESGATIPFISRYRKEATGSLDEVAVADLASSYKQVKELITRKNYILDTIKEQGKLTNNLKSQIEATWDLLQLEDIYLPYKRKQTTKAAAARAAGLEELANIIFRSKTRHVHLSAKNFINKDVESEEDAISGALDIIAEQISEHSVAREITRDVFARTASLSSKLIKSKENDAQKYKNYFDFSQSLQKIPSHRLLAMYRAEEEKLLRVRIEIDQDKLLHRLGRYFIKNENECSEYVSTAIEDSAKRLLIPSITNEVRKAAKAKADDEAIDVFSENLRQLLLAPPLGSKRILAIDPGFRTGCKVAVVDETGTFKSSKTIYPHQPQSRELEAEKDMAFLLEKHRIQAIAIGNGTAGRETMTWLQKSIKSIPIFLVNESGASIYSASELAREEFPDLDLTIRGAISIGRRLMDPLAELVKIDAKSIGVGQYQHDVNQPKLKEKLDQVVVNSVNKVGVNLNTASQHLLSYVSGLGPVLAQNIVDHREQNGPFTSRKELLSVARMGAKSFEQSAGFLRIRNGKNPLDNTAVHPESYNVVKSIAKTLGESPKNLIENSTLLEGVSLQEFVTEKTGIPTLRDIIAELKKPGLDPRGEAKVFHFTEGLRTIQDLSVGMKLKGIVNNLTKFGAFVDIGIKESGLIHISQITDKFIKDPSEVLKLGQEVEALVTDLDVTRKRISLSLKFAD